MHPFVLAGPAPPEMTAMPLIVGGSLMALGAASIVGGLSGADRFFESSLAAAVVNLVGVGGARVLFLLLGLAAVVLGFLIATADPPGSSTG